MVNFAFTCPECAHSMQLPEALSGKTGQCPNCKQTVAISKPLSLPTSSDLGELPPAANDPATPFKTAVAAPVPAGIPQLAAAAPMGHMAGKASHRGTLLLILSIVSFVLGCVGLILGPIVFFMAKKDLREMDAGRMDPTGRGVTTFGFVGGIISTLTGILTVVVLGFMIFAMFLPAVSNARDVARNMSSRNNLKLIGLGVRRYHDTYGEIPAGESSEIRYDSGKPLLSWRVHVLPFIGEDALYDRFNLEEPWDSSHNLPLLQLMPPNYIRPGYESTTKTVYVAPFSARGVLDSNEQVRLRDIMDGEAQTIMVIEVPESMAVPWTQPGAVMFDLEKVRSEFPGPDRHLNVLFADGSVIPVSLKNSPMNWEFMFDRSDGQAVFPD